MRKITFLALTALMFTGSLTLKGQVNIALWDMNFGNDASSGTGTTLPAIGTGTLSLLGGVTSPSFNAGSPVDPNLMDNSGWQTTSYPAQSTAPKTAGIQIDVNTTGYNNIQISFEQRLSNTVANTWVLQYTLDNSVGIPVWVDATTYTFVPQPTGTGDTWYSRTYDFSAVTGLNNNPNAGFRVVSDYDPLAGIYLAARSTSSYSTAGTSRFDMIRVYESAPVVSFASAHQSVSESAGTINAVMNINGANTQPCKVAITTSVHTTATGGGADYTISNDTVTFPASSASPQNFAIQINDDALSENAEYISFKIGNVINGSAGTQNFHILYIRDNDYTAPTPTNEVMLQLLTSFSTGAEGSNSAEIVAYDSASQKLVTANSINNNLDIIDFSNPSSPGPITSIDLTSVGGINSVDVRNGYIAVALQNGVNPQDSGRIAFYDMTGTLINQVTVGAMPDMITFNHAGTKVYAACEGEPTLGSYLEDPEGEIAVVDISGGIASINFTNVTLINFNAFDSQIATLQAAGVRIYGNLGTATVSEDVEPEYITISDDDQTAWVTLQEANAIAKINLLTNTVTDILPLGKINHLLTANGMDGSDQSSGINIANYPVLGLYEPDAITHMNIGGTNYLFTANEGDTRADFGAANNEESRISTLTLDPTVFVDQNILKSNFFLGRMSASNKTGDIDSDGDIDELHVFGGRGFSVWTENGTLVYNSGNLLEQIIANHPTFSTIFNATNSNSITAKNRSDDKGPEIEGVAVANIDGDNILFVSSERIGGVFLFNIDNPASPRYIGYYNNRTTTLPSGPDRGAEGILYISAEASPNGNALLILANEISSTLSIYQINTCASLSNIDITITPDDTVCTGDTVVFSTTVGANTSLQWLMNNSNVAGATGTNLNTTSAGNYSLAVANSTYLCADTTAEYSIILLANPTATINTGDTVACEGEQLTLTSAGGTPIWNNGVTEGVAFTPATTDYYVLTVTAPNGCSDMDSVQVIVNPLPAVVGNVTDNTVCTGTTITFNGGGASTYTWTGGVTNNTPMVATASGTYTVTGTDVNACSNTATVSITVYNLPTVAFNNTVDSVCLSSGLVTLNGGSPSGGTFSGPGVSGGQFNSNTGLGSYVLSYTYTDGNGCSNMDTDNLSVIPCLSVDEANDLVVSIYPNPADEIIYIELNNGNPYFVTVYDMNGKVAVSNSMQNEGMLQVSHLAAGLYTVKVEQDGTIILSKVLIK